MSERHYSADEVRHELGTKEVQSFLVRAAGGGPIVGARINTDLNPFAPKRLVIGPSGAPNDRRSVIGRATELATTGSSIRVFMRPRHRYPYSDFGWWRVDNFDTSAEGQRQAFLDAPHRAARPRPPVGVLRLVQAGPPD